MDIYKFVKKIKKTQDVLDNNSKVCLRLGNGEYEIDYVLINEDANKCILKIDNIAELDLIHKIITFYEKNNKNINSLQSKEDCNEYDN